MGELPEKIDTRPLYDRAAEALERLIERGEYKPGDQLPSEEVLAKQMGISRATLREVLGNLESAGVITRRHGVGTFISAPARGRLHGGLEQLLSFRSLLSSASGGDRERVWMTGEIEANRNIAELLHLDPGTTLLHVEMIASLEDIPFAYLDSYVEKKYVDVDELLSYEEGSLLNYLFEKDGPRISYTQTNIYAIAAVAHVASRLDTKVGEPVLHLVETFYSDTGQPAFHSLNYFLTERLDFHIVRRMLRR